MKILAELNSPRMMSAANKILASKLEQHLALCIKTPYEEESSGTLLIDLHHLRELFQAFVTKL